MAHISTRYAIIRLGLYGAGMLSLFQPAYCQDADHSDETPNVISTVFDKGSTTHIARDWFAESEIDHGMITLHAARHRAVAPDDGPGLARGDRHSNVQFDAAYRIDLTSRDTVGLALTGAVDRRRFPGRTIDPRALMSGGYEAALQWRRTDRFGISAGWFGNGLSRHRAVPDRIAELANGAPLAGQGFHLGLEAPAMSGGDTTLTFDLRAQHLSQDDAMMLDTGPSRSDQRIAIGLRTHF